MKQFNIDWDNPSDLKKHITILQRRRKDLLRNLGYNEIHFNGGKYNLDTLLPAFESMFNSNFEHLFESENKGKHFYVYFHCNPLKPLHIQSSIKHLFLASKFPNLKYEPFYVGKGSGDRCFDLNRNNSHRKIKQQLSKFKKEIEVVKVLENLSETEALNKESILIDILGLVCFSKHGMLMNLDEGKENQTRRELYNNELIKKILKSNGFK